MVSESAPLLSGRRLRLSYGETPALDGVDLDLHSGERVAVMGPSGSGKSSLLHCLAGVVRPQAGEVLFRGERVDTRSEAARSALRLRHLGMVFQFGDLVPELTLAENVMLPLQLLGRRREAHSAALALMERLDIAQVADERAGTVSGGQAQRAAVARALVHGPAVVLADEPTGSLDSVAAEKVLDAMVELTASTGAALLVVTHDHLVASHLTRLVVIRDGRVDERGRASLDDGRDPAGPAPHGGRRRPSRLRSLSVALATTIGTVVLLALAAVTRAELRVRQPPTSPGSAGSCSPSSSA